MTDMIIQPIGDAARNFLRLARARRDIAFLRTQGDRDLAKICASAGYLVKDKWHPSTIMHVTERGVSYLDKLARCE